MQAAGRLRMLGRGQTVRFLGPADVSAKIRTANGLGQGGAITARHVLQWVMANTTAATLQGVTTWSSHGLHFAAVHGAPQRALVDEVLELEQMYGRSLAPQLAGAVVRTMCDSTVRRCTATGGLAAQSQSLMECIVSSAEQHGRGHSVVAGKSNAEDECERELEQEEEEEEEVERQVRDNAVCHSQHAGQSVPGLRSTCAPRVGRTLRHCSAVHTVALLIEGGQAMLDTSC